MKTNFLAVSTALVLVASTAIYLKTRNNTSPSSMSSKAQEKLEACTLPWAELTEALKEPKDTYLEKLKTFTKMEDCSDARVFRRELGEKLNTIKATNAKEADAWLKVLFATRHLTDGELNLHLDEVIGNLIKESPKTFLSLYSETYPKQKCDGTLVSFTGDFGEDPELNHRKLIERRKSLLTVRDRELIPLRDSCLLEIQQSLQISS